ncbi:hypothetical protein pippi81_gp029 [Flavobacterium phage vB_FspM_pippi8-1]|uniref:Uncharacterized protein n=1 Tax=Flavobacterium phage vB_FspM_pippi8-1 TaxID=2686244 RepID=A0A6B9LB43_9CAUD|nr:hypothetical protein HWC86_gp29 [Flavobacterium phage vB_FspM_pippi8-1]QHB38593.1 hypothetical protein pippi81_gp029 [Flavobacterium phage vB_FspM_pippi8-1]
MIKCNFKNEEIVISDGEIKLSEGVSFLEGIFETFDTAPEAGSPEIAFFEAFLQPLGFEITEEEEEPKEIY